MKAPPGVTGLVLVLTLDPPAPPSRCFFFLRVLVWYPLSYLLKGFAVFYLNKHMSQGTFYDYFKGKTKVPCHKEKIKVEINYHENKRRY